MSKDNVNIYEMPDLDEMNRRAEALEQLWKDFIKSEGEENLKYYLHKQNLFEIIKRQDQRMHYLYIFHGLEYPCEYKYIAIECFWINTLKPFMVVDETSKLYNSPNEKFSLFLILSTISAIYKIYKKDQVFVEPSLERMKDIIYDFKYCSISREGMISFVETFADTYGVGIEFILTEKKKIIQELKGNPILKLFGNFVESGNNV